MKLERIIGLQAELFDVEKFFKGKMEIELFANVKDMERFIKDKIVCMETLLIAATDETIALGKSSGIATMAYANSDIPNQSYAGVDMLVEGFEEVDADFLEKVFQRHHRIPWTILETKRCIVRELCLDDLDGLFELYADDGMDDYTEGLYPYEEEKEFQRAYIEHMYRYFGYGMWLVFSKDTGKIIGRAGLEHREYNGETELELGYLIGKKYQGQGYATEVCKAILDYAKENVYFPRINTLVDAENEVSIALTKKLGFEYEEDFEMNGRRMCRFIKKFEEE